MTLTPIRKGERYLREVTGHGGGVIKAFADSDGLLIKGAGFVSWDVIGALAAKAMHDEYHAKKPTKKAKR